MDELNKPKSARKRIKELEKICAIDTEQITELVKEIKQLEKINRTLRRENEQLAKDNKKITRILEVALNFIERVKNSIFGKIFFVKDIKGLNEGQADVLEGEEK